MNLFPKLGTILIALVLIAPTSAAAAPPPGCIFNDVCQGEYFYDGVAHLVSLGAVSGYGDGTFRPFNNASRGQVAKIVVVAENLTIDTTGGPHFSDVSPDNPFYPFIETALNREIINGYNDFTFRWSIDIIRGQLCKIVVQAEGWTPATPGERTFSDVLVGNPFYIAIETAYQHGVVSGYADGTFRPFNTTTRGQIAKIVNAAVTEPASK